MRRILGPLVVVALLVLAAACAWFFLRYRDVRARYLELSAAEQSSLESYGRTLAAIAEIQDSLDAIAPRDSLVRLDPGSLVTEEQLAGPSGREALERIASLRASIARSRERIERLEADLARSGVQADGMRRVIANLQRDLAGKQAALDEMVGQVASLQGQVSGLQSEVQHKSDSLLVRDAALEERRYELATVYYVVGTRKQLLARGAIVMKGGVLGLGGTPVPTGELPQEDLTPLDTDVTTVIPTNAAKARVLTPQPARSYELRPAGGRLELHILDPAEFRKVRQVVILTE